MERFSTSFAREYDPRVSPDWSRLAEEYVAAGLVFQERQIGYIPNDDYTKSLRVAVSWQDHFVHGKINITTLMRYEFRNLSAWYARVQIANGKP